MNLSESWSSKHHIPDDILPLILSRVPIKSLLTFRFVSKSWCSLIEHPGFCRLQLNNSSRNNLQQTNLFVAQPRPRSDGGTYFCIVYRTDTSVHSLEIFRDRWRIVYSMDGLFLLRDDNGALMLWNPSIGRVRALPPSPINETSLLDVMNVDLGFGFDPLIKDYKILRLSTHMVDEKRHFLIHPDGLISIAIYTVGAGLWKTIQFHAEGISDWYWHIYECCRSKTVCLRGCIYMILWNKNSKTRELVSSDLSTEVFASKNLPIDSHYPKCRTTSLVNDGGRSLGLIHCFGYPTTQAIFWVLESSNSKADLASMFWTKRYTFASTISVDYNGNCVEHNSSKSDILYLNKTGEIVLTSKQVILSYNLETGEQKSLFDIIVQPLQMERLCIYEYKESLVLLNG